MGVFFSLSCRSVTLITLGDAGGGLVDLVLVGVGDRDTLGLAVDVGSRAARQALLDDSLGGGGSGSGGGGGRLGGGQDGESAGDDDGGETHLDW